MAAGYVWSKKLQEWLRLSGGGGIAVLDDLSDVVITGTPADNEVVAYDTATGKFINQTPAGGGGTNELLDGTAHTDTLAGTVVRGDIIIANSTPKWARVAKGAVREVLVSDGTDPAWGAIPGAYFPPMPPNWIRTDGVTGFLSNGAARPTTGVQYFPGTYVRASFSADEIVYMGWLLPSKFPAGTMSLRMLSTCLTNPVSTKTIIVTLEWDDIITGAGDLDSVSWNDEGTETQSFTSTDQYVLQAFNHNFGTVPTAGRLLVCKVTFETASTLDVDSVWQFFLRWL